MPLWIRAAFFDPEEERKRITVHDYQTNKSLTEQRAVKDCRLIDEIELPLKSFEDFHHAASHAVQRGLGEYLKNFICPQPGDWPAQFYMQQLKYNAPGSKQPFLQNIIPFIGPLHVQLNAGVWLCRLNIELFKIFYVWVFRPHKKLPNKPQAPRVTLELELVCGGWTVVRDVVLITFARCKDILFLNIVNILDNYLPAVLLMYSIIFKSGKTKLYIDALLRIWVMFFCYRRHHYNKAPLVWLSNFLFWEKQQHPLFDTLM